MKGMKKFLAVALALVLVLSVLPMPAKAAGTDTTVYLLPNGNWTQSNAWFAAYYFEGEANGWVKLSGPDANGYYKGTIPAGYSGLVFTRMNPSASALDWSSRWDQTTDLPTPITNNVYFAVKDGDWNNATGTWTSAPKTSTYTVTGSAGLCGSNWTPTDTNNDMELKDGLWTKTYTNVPAETYEFKVVKDHAWGSEWPAENYVLNLTQTSDVVITFNRATGEVKATVVIPVTGLTLDQSSVALYKGQIASLTVAVTPSNATETVTWSSSDNSVATVSDGVVTAVGGGTATITAAAGGMSANCTVTVTEITSPVTLDVADGSIFIYSDGYQQGTAAKIPYTGSYIITGTTTNSCMIQITGIGSGATVTMQDVSVTCSGPPILMTNVPIHATGTLKLHSSNSLAVSSSLMLTGDANVDLLGYSPAISGNVNITCNSFHAESTNSVGISSGSITINAAEDITILAGSGPAITGPAKLTAGGDILAESKNSNVATGNLEATAGGDITLKTNSGSPAVSASATLEAAGNVSISNPGGMAVSGKLTVKDAASVTVTGKEKASPVLGGGADITSDGDVTISGTMCADAYTPNGYKIISGGDISITGSNIGLSTGGIVTLEADGDIAVTGKSNTALSYSSQPASVKAGGDVTLTGSSAPTIVGGAALSVEADGDITVTNDNFMAMSVSGNVTMTSGGSVTLSGGGSAPAVSVSNLTVTAANTIAVEQAGTNCAMSGTKATLTAQDIVISAPKNTAPVLCSYTTQGHSFTDTFTTVHGATSVKVTLLADGLILTGSNIPAEGKGFEAVLSAGEGCGMPDEITVTVGGTKLTSGYTYDAATGKITIDAASITGDVVIDATIPVTTVTLDKTTVAAFTGDELTLTATVNPTNATDKTITWSSSNTSVATVENGVVTTKAAGVVTITATAGGKSASCMVTVQNPVASVTIGGVTKNYSSLKTALSAVKACTAEDNAVVKVLSDVTLAQAQEVESGVFTLDLGTATITSPNSVAIMFNGGTVEITGSGKIVGFMAISLNSKNANVTISGGTYESTGGTAIMSSGNLTVNDGTIRNAQGSYNQGISATGGSLTINGGTIEGGDAGLYLFGCQVSITDGNITGGNAAVSHNDNQYSSGTISISGGSFVGDTEMFDGCFGSLGRLPVLTGGSFPGGLVTGSRSGAFPVNDLLADGYAYWQNGKMLTLADDVTSIEGAVEVKPVCKHNNGGYTCEGDTISFECADCGTTAEAKLVAPENLAYNGEEKTVTVESTFAGAQLPEVTYEGDRTNVGTFTAKLTLAEGIEAELDVTITPAKLTVESIEVEDKVYDGNTDAVVTDVVVSGIIGSDDVKVVPTGQFVDKNVGTDKTVNVAFLVDGTDSGNYTVENATATASITPAVITVTAVSAANKTYDGNTSATITSINITGTVEGDDIAVKGAGKFADKNVGTGKPVSVTFTLSGADAGNYELAETTGSTTASITKPKDPSSPSTGDDNNMMLWTVMMILSITAAAALVTGKKRYI